MKRSRKLAMLLLAILVASPAMWFLLNESPHSVNMLGELSETEISNNLSEVQPVASTGALEHAGQKPGSGLRLIFETLNHSPIEFYGRALDQFGLPVAEAEVQGVLLYNTGLKSGVKTVLTSTDSQGYFQFRGLAGQDLGIGISKSGYEYRSHHSSFSYSYFEADHKRHQPDSKQPVVFVLWKKTGAESLIHYDLDRDIPADGTPVRINLATGETGVSEADLTISVSRTPLRMRFGERDFSWSAMVDVEEGGLIRVGQLDYYNLAPELGYVPQFQFAQESRPGGDEREWRESFSDDFFISSRGGKNFAHITLRILANADRAEGDDVAAVRTVVWLNPNGSRNLEFDPAKEIPLPRR